jgi:hypothetical protein
VPTNVEQKWETIIGKEIIRETWTCFTVLHTQPPRKQSYEVTDEDTSYNSPNKHMAIQMQLKNYKKLHFL